MATPAPAGGWQGRDAIRAPAPALATNRAAARRRTCVGNRRRDRPAPVYPGRWSSEAPPARPRKVGPHVERSSIVRAFARCAGSRDSAALACIPASRTGDGWAGRMAGASAVLGRDAGMVGFFGEQSKNLGRSGRCALRGGRGRAMAYDANLRGALVAPQRPCPASLDHVR